MTSNPFVHYVIAYNINSECILAIQFHNFKAFDSLLSFLQQMRLLFLKLKVVKSPQRIVEESKY